ncbi:glucuronide transporter [Sinomonas cyclohexanicum]|uniref:Glucuronide transporter n=1 Tax=Sinomonas cyclohexanicum TaxID=322009 RepID=A0ABM7PQZ9_SINCY|nr:glucuronide transporter [Corynebacterium cyclohexanicum]BCT74600.1 glucuronide transporter [Corynebacterium cyclohexanicum]
MSTTTHHKLPLKSLVGYGAGDAANNLAFTTTAMFLLVYYTDVAGIPAAAAGTLFLVVRLFDAFSDLFAGRMVDRTNTKRWGKFRPFILFGSLPLMVLTFLNFHVPQIGEGGKLAYAYIVYAALGLAYSLVNIPYGSMASAMTQNPKDRAKLASARTVGSLLVGSALGIFVAPLLKAGTDLQPVFTTVTLVFMVLGVALYLFTFFTTRETVQRDVPKVSFRQSMRTLKGNRPLLMLCLSSLLFLSGYLSMSTVQVYYFRDALHALSLVPVLSIVQLVLTLVLSAWVPTLVTRFGKRAVYMAFIGVGVVGGLLVMFVPTTIVWLAFIGFTIGLGGIAGVSIVVWALEADTVEYGEWKTGVRSEGIIYSLFSFTRKTGQAIGGALAAYVIGIAGYDGHAVAQTAGAVTGIQAAAGLIPAVLGAAAGVIMFFYELTDARHAKIVAEIRARHEQAGAGLGSDADTVAKHSQPEA